MENTKGNKIFFIMPAAIFLATVLALSTFTVSLFAQSEGRTGQDVGHSAGQAGQDVQQGAGDMGSKITEGAKDLAGNIGEGVQNLGK